MKTVKEYLSSTKGFNPMASVKEMKQFDEEPEMEEVNDYTNSDIADIININVPLITRLFEYLIETEDMNDVKLHEILERLISESKNNNPLTMDSYMNIIGNDNMEEPTGDGEIIEEALPQGAVSITDPSQAPKGHSIIKGPRGGMYAIPKSGSGGKPKEEPTKDTQTGLHKTNQTKTISFFPDYGTKDLKGEAEKKLEERGWKKLDKAKVYLNKKDKEPTEITLFEKDGEKYYIHNWVQSLRGISGIQMMKVTEGKVEGF